MADFRILIYALAGIIIGIALFINGLMSFKRKRLMENIPTSKIRSVAMGLAEIYGEIVAVRKKVISSPFSGTKCVYCDYKVEKLVSSGKSSHWSTIKKGGMGEHFFLKDDTGSILVSTEGANFDITKDNQYDTHYGKKPPKRAIDFLEANGISTKGLLFKHRLRLTEKLLSPRDKVYVLGTAGDNPLVEDASSADNTKDIMMQKGSNEKIFYISDTYETGALKKFRNRMIVGLGLGSILILGGLLVFFWYLRML